MSSSEAGSSAGMARVATARAREDDAEVMSRNWHRAEGHLYGQGASCRRSVSMAWALVFRNRCSLIVLRVVTGGGRGESPGEARPVEAGVDRVRREAQGRWLAAGRGRLPKGVTHLGLWFSAVQSDPSGVNH